MSMGCRPLLIDLRQDMWRKFRREALADRLVQGLPRRPHPPRSLSWYAGRFDHRLGLRDSAVQKREGQDGGFPDRAPGSNGSDPSMQHLAEVVADGCLSSSSRWLGMKPLALGPSRSLRGPLLAEAISLYGIVRDCFAERLAMTEKKGGLP